jgi:hypothetical protein
VVLQENRPVCCRGLDPVHRTPLVEGAELGQTTHPPHAMMMPLEMLYVLPVGLAQKLGAGSR